MFIEFQCLERRKLMSALIWAEGPALPEARTGAVAVATGSVVRIVGGDGLNATEVPQITAGGDIWSLGQNIDTQRNELGAFATGGAILLFGGTGNNEGSDEVLRYDYQFGDSEDVEKMNQIRYDFGYAADASGRAYAFGGIGVFDDGEIWAESERYDVATDTWTAIASLPRPLRGMSAIGDGNGHIFVFGGSTTLDDSGIQDTTYVYDIATDAWSNAAPMLTGTRDSAVVMDHSGAIYVLGGMTLTGPTGDVQVYDSTINAWAMQTALPEVVYSLVAAYDANGQIIVAGGFDSTGSATAAVYRTQRLDVAETAPVITSNPVIDASLDQLYSYTIQASGNPAPAFALIDAPDGMTIDSSSGHISWQPIEGQLGLHSVTVRASNVVGDVDQTFDITVLADTIAPTAPANVLVANATETSFTLSWDASTDAIGVDHYEVFTAVYTGPRFGKRWVYTLVDTVTATSSTISGLAPFTGKTVSIQAVDAAGNRSARSPHLSVTTLAAPDLSYSFGTQTSGTVESPAKASFTIQLHSRANPSATFSIVSGPASMTVDANTGLVQWTPTVDDIGLHDVVLRATNSVASTDLTVAIDVLSDAPNLSVQYNPATGGNQFALAGTLFNAQIHDASHSPSTYSSVAAPIGMTIDPSTGLISWTPTGDQGGAQTVTVRGVNEGGTTDLTFGVNTLFTGEVTGVQVTGTTLAEPTASWIAPTGEGAELVDSYQIRGFAEWGVGRTRKTHTVNYPVQASETSILMTGLNPGKIYALTITPVDSSGNLGLADNETSFSSIPALPQIRWEVNGFSGGSSRPGPVIAEQVVEIVLTDDRPDPSTISLLSAPEGLVFDAVTNTANWTPGAADVTTGYTTANVTFQVTNSVGTVDVVVPIRVYFSGSVRNASTIRYGNTATAQWDAPVDNVTPIAGYSITRSWTWSGRNRSTTWTVGADVTNITFSLIPTGAVSHKGISITPIDEFGNLGVSTGRILYGQAQNDLPPVAFDDAYAAIEDTVLTVDYTNGLRTNDIDTDNTPFINPLTIHRVTNPANGTLVLDTSGAFTYTPNANFNGIDTFTYRANDGVFNSNIATVTINVGSVNEAPSALNDYYNVNQDKTLSIDAASGVLANDFDIDGDPLNVAVVDAPANGSVSLNADGSFVYTPDADYSGNDSFTYVATDSLLDSRASTVWIYVRSTITPLGSTKFFVVDSSANSTFEYDPTGAIVESYGLSNNNQQASGVATDQDGLLTWTIDNEKQVFVYNNDGTVLGDWTPEGIVSPEGIATDGRHIWIVDRDLGKVFYFAEGATRRNSAFAADARFALDPANSNPKGMTTDGSHLWVVNDGQTVDQVFKYDITGVLIGSWVIDTFNSSPTGITIDPNNVADVWIVDNATDRIFQYMGASARMSGQQSADKVFALDGQNLNPQGIADPIVDPELFPPTDPMPTAADQVYGDTDNDGDVDALDLFRFRNSFLTRTVDDSFDPRFDRDGDGDVDAVDLFSFRNNFLSSAPGLIDPVLANTTPDADDLAGNTVGTARDLGALIGFQGLTGFVGSNDLKDYYKFSVSAPTSFSASLFDSSNRTSLLLLDADGNVIANTAYDGNRRVTELLGPGDYYLLVTSTGLNSPYVLLLNGLLAN